MDNAILDSEERQAGILDQVLAIGQAAQQHIIENPKQVYELIAEAVCKATGADCAVLYPYHPAFGEFYDLDNVAAYGLRHELQVEIRVDRRKGLTARIHTRGEIICENVEDIEWEDTHPYRDTPLIAREEIKAFMGLSLTVGENILGILYVDYRSSHHFSEDEKRIIRLFGQQAALAVSNSWTSRLAAIRAVTVSRLKTIGQSLVAIEDPSETLDSVLQGIAYSAQEVLDADIVDLYQYIQARNEFVLPPALVGDRWHPHVPKNKIYDDDVVMRVVKIGEPQYFHDPQGTSLLTGKFEVPRDDAPDQRFVVREGVASSAMIPLMAAGETVGVMFVNYRTPQFFEQGQRDVIESFAAQAAIAIQNQRLFSESLRQRNELEVVDEIGELLMATLDPREIPRLLLQQVIRLFGVEGASLWRVDRAAQTVRCVFSLDRRGEEESFAEIMRKQVFRLGEGIVGTVSESGEAMIASEVRAEPRWSERVDEATGFRTRSVLAVPLVYQQETIGVIEVLNRLDETPFTQDDCDFLAAIVSPAAIALENARLFYEVNQTLERRVEALSALNEVGQTLTSGIRLREDEILELIYKQAHRLTATQDMYIALYDDATDTIRFGLAVREGKREAYESRKADMERRGRTEEVILTRQPLLHRTHQEAMDWYALPGHEEFIGGISLSWLGVPMMVGDKVLGMIALWDWEREHAYDEFDLQVLTSMASPAAIALDNANLYYEVNQALERRVEALSALNEVGQALTSDIRLSEDEILELIYEQARRLTGAQDMYIALYDDATQMIRFGLAMEGGQRVEIAEPRQADMERRGKTEEIILTKHAILHRTKQEAEDWYASPGHQEFIGRISPSWLGVPMLVGEKVLGVIALQDWEREQAYDELDKQVLASMASQAAIAIDSARLFESTRQIAYERQRRLELLQQISEKMAEASLDPDEVLELVAKGANDVTSSDLTSIYRYDQEASNFTRGVRVSPGRDVEQIAPDDLPSPDELPTRIAQTQDAVFVEDVKKRPEDFAFARRHRLQAVAGLPLTTVGTQGMRTTLGVLFLNFREPHTFSDDEQEILRHLANQAAVAIAYAGAQESAQAKEQLAALGTAAATLQHRLGNTINVILPAVMRLRYRVGDDPNNMEILDTIERNALFATEVIRRMQTPLRQEPFVLTNINGLLRDAIQKCIQDTDRFPDILLTSNVPGLSRDDLDLAVPPQQQITITTDLDKNLPETHASSGQLTEVFRVLAENAIKAIYPQSGSVTIVSKFEDDRLRPCVEITVSDTGKGIDEKTRSRLFQQPVPRKEFGQGAGLGLWLSNIIVRSHQGSIELQSTEINKGSTFVVRLPILKQAPPSPTSQGGEIS